MMPSFIGAQQDVADLLGDVEDLGPRSLSIVKVF
jgi:hypothetical protein